MIRKLLMYVFIGLLAVFASVLDRELYAQERAAETWVPSASLLVLTVFGCGYAAAETGDASSKVALCDVLAHPTDYSGKTLTMTVRITATKEGSFLWSSNCRKLGLSLQIEDEAKSDADIQNLLKVLRLHGLSGHPVVATLTGVFLYHQENEQHRRRSIFRVSAASEIKQDGVKPVSAPDVNPLRNEEQKALDSTRRAGMALRSAAENV